MNSRHPQLHNKMMRRSQARVLLLCVVAVVIVLTLFEHEHREETSAGNANIKPTDKRKKFKHAKIIQIYPRANIERRKSTNATTKLPNTTRTSTPRRKVTKHHLLSTKASSTASSSSTSSTTPKTTETAATTTTTTLSTAASKCLPITASKESRYAYLPRLECLHDLAEKIQKER